MAKREKFTVHLVCPECGSEGAAECDENENPVYSGGLDRSIESVSKGFRISGGRAFCGQCGVPVTLGSN
jgi:hypothetical protein